MTKDQIMEEYFLDMLDRTRAIEMLQEHCNLSLHDAEILVDSCKDGETE